MKIQEKLKALVTDLTGMRFTAPKSRNRHRELDSAFDSFSSTLKSIAERIEALQEACDTNMTLFESLIDLYERKHIIVADNCPPQIADFARDLFNSMRGLLHAYENVKDASDPI